jgi:3-oxoacyl-[acyl-carrier protein] reductase
MELPEGTVALVTGGGSGIGRGIAAAFAAAGAAVAVTGRRREVVEAAAAQIRAGGARAVAVQGDVAREDDARRMVEETVRELGTIHVLVNNAGLARRGPIGEMPSADVDAVIDVDLKGPIRMIRAALATLASHQETGGASIVNVSSSMTFSVVPDASVYSAAKAGLDMLTRCLARDLASVGVRVNAICPGVVETPIFETMMPRRLVGRVLRRVAAQTPLGRVGQPSDVARLALFLASPEAAWMTGAVIPLDGGLSLVG